MAATSRPAYQRLPHCVSVCYRDQVPESTVAAYTKDTVRFTIICGTAPSPNIRSAP